MPIYQVLFYRLPKKLRFHSCLFVHRGGGPVWTLLIMHRTSPHRDPQTYSKSFILDLTVQGSHRTCSTWTSTYKDSPDMFKLAQLVNLDLTVRDAPPPPPPPPVHLQTCSLQSSYGWQVAGWHPTGILSYLKKGFSRPSCVSSTTDTPNSRFTF